MSHCTICWETFLTTGRQNIIANQKIDKIKWIWDFSEWNDKAQQLMVTFKQPTTHLNPMWVAKCPLNSRSLFELNQKIITFHLLSKYVQKCAANKAKRAYGITMKINIRTSISTLNIRNIFWRNWWLLFSPDSSGFLVSQSNMSIFSFYFGFCFCFWFCLDQSIVWTYLNSEISVLNWMRRIYQSGWIINQSGIST